MKLATALDEKGHSFIGVIIQRDTKILHVEKLEKELYGTSLLPNDMLETIRMGDLYLQTVRELMERGKRDRLLSSCAYSLSEVKLLAPVPRPAKNIFCIGKNYREHAMEMGSEQDIPTDLIVFTKAPTTVIGHGEDIPNHREVTAALDYEGELAVIIGKRGVNIKRSEAKGYIYGYTIINDVTARDLQSRHRQYFLGKSLDGTCPIGPWIVHKSALSDSEPFQITTKVNGELRQQASTADFIFSLEEIIATLSKGMTLEAGDIIATGTPAGVGKGFRPPRYLQIGDRVEITVSGIGTLCNRIGK